jgi:hypothetical protein
MDADRQGVERRVGAELRLELGLEGGDLLSGDGVQRVPPGHQHRPLDQAGGGVALLLVGQEGLERHADHAAQRRAIRPPQPQGRTQGLEEKLGRQGTSVARPHRGQGTRQHCRLLRRHRFQQIRDLLQLLRA